MPDKNPFHLPKFADLPEIHEFLTAWNNWRADDIIPDRCAVALADIHQCLGHAMLFDMVSEDEIHCRYMGDAFLDIYGQDFTGSNYLDLTEPQFREIRSKRLHGVVDKPCAAVWATVRGPNSPKLPLACGVSVPIRPNRPDRPKQLMQFAVMLEGYEQSAFVARVKTGVVDFSDHFAFVDIGAGCPEVPQPARFRQAPVQAAL